MKTSNHYQKRKESKTAERQRNKMIIIDIRKKQIIKKVKNNQKEIILRIRKSIGALVRKKSPPTDLNPHQIMMRLKIVTVFRVKI